MGFDRLGFVALGEDGTLRRLPYTTLELARGGNTIEPVGGALDEVCRIEGRLELGKGGVSLVFLEGEALLWQKGVGMLACVDGTWRTERTWQERAAKDWAEVISSSTADSSLLVVTPDGSLQIHGRSKLLAQFSRGEFERFATTALGLAPCQVHDVESSHSRQAVMMRCGPDRTEAVCALRPTALEPQDCRVLPEGGEARSGFHQAGVFAAFDQRGRVTFFTAASNFEPFARRKEPWQVRVLSFGVEGESIELAKHELVEERIPRGQDVLKWLTVVHPPLLFCDRTSTPGLICWADRDSAYYFDMHSRALRAVFHPADRIPAVGQGFIAVRGRGRHYILEIAKP